MKTNVGMIDASLRLLVGLAILSLMVVGPKTWWGLLGLIPIATAIMGYCPLYAAFGLRTCGHEGRRQRPT